MEKTKENHLLTGPISQQLVLLAVPLLLGNILQQCYNIVDSMIIGRYLGMDAFAAVGIAGTVMNLMIFILNGFCTGLSVIFSMLYGKADWKEFRREMFTAVSCGGGAAAALSLIFLAGVRPVLALIRTPEELMGYTVEYLQVIAAGLIAVYAYNLFSGILRSIGNTLASLLFLLFSVAVNMVLDLAFVAGLQWGTAGAAWATVLAQMLSAAGCCGYLWYCHRDLIFTGKEVGFHADLLRKTLRFGAASALQESNLYIGKMLVQGAVNLLGTGAIAGFTAALRLEGFCNSFGDGGALAMSVLISQNHGAGNPERVKESLKKGVKFHVILGIVIPFLMYLLTVPGLRLFLGEGNSEALEQGRSYLQLIALFYILCFVGSALVGYFRGTGKVHVPVIGTTLNITTRVLLAYPMTQRFGLAGLAVSTGIGWMMVVSYQLLNLRMIRKNAGKTRNAAY